MRRNLGDRLDRARDRRQRRGLLDDSQGQGLRLLAPSHHDRHLDRDLAEALVQNLQSDIHFSHTGGVPDFLPFADGGVAVSFGTANYGGMLPMSGNTTYELVPMIRTSRAGALPWQSTVPHQAPT